MSQTPDLNGLFDRSSHNPSFFSLQRTMEDSASLLDFCVPCNPYFPPKSLFESLSANLETILKYYPSDSEVICERLCKNLDLDPETVVIANGSTELITWIDHLLIRESIATPIPTFGRWTDQPRETGKRLHAFRLTPQDGFHLSIDSFIRYVRTTGARTAVICNPNNPTGGYVRREELSRMVAELSDLDLIIIDESFIDFVETEEYPSMATEAAESENLIVLKSLGKNFGLHGIRLGYAVGAPTLIHRVREALPKWNLNSLAEAVIFSLQKEDLSYRQSLRRIHADRRDLIGRLREIPSLSVYPSQGNFVLVKLGSGLSGKACRDFLLAQHQIFVRECGNKMGIDSSFLRIVCRPPADVDRLVLGLEDFLAATIGSEPKSVPLQQSKPCLDRGPLALFVAQDHK